eukprot:423135-Prymnesium_polylepis.1
MVLTPPCLRDADRIKYPGPGLDARSRRSSAECVPAVRSVEAGHAHRQRGCGPVEVPGTRGGRVDGA